MEMENIENVENVNNAILKKQRHLQQIREWQARNKEHIKVRKHLYDMANKERNQIYNRVYYINNKQEPENIDCKICNSSFNINNTNKHLQSKKHLRNEQLKTQVIADTVEAVE